MDEGVGSAMAAVEDEAQELLLVQEPNVAAGRFASNVQVSRSDDHFVLSFMAIDPLDPPAGQKRPAYLVARVFLTAGHMRRLYNVLGKQVKTLDDDGVELAD